VDEGLEQLGNINGGLSQLEGGKEIVYMLQAEFKNMPADTGDDEKTLLLKRHVLFCL